MTAVQRAAIGSPATGLMVYDTDSSRVMQRTASAWKGYAFTSEASLTSDSLAIRRAGTGLIHYVGWDSENSGGTSAVHASQNIYVGYQAGKTTTTAVSNIGIGPNVLDAITIGGENIAIGDNALTSDTSGTRNVAIGAAALEALTNGGSNTAVGYFAGRSITTGGSNVAVGVESLEANLTGSSNVAIGLRAAEDYTGSDIVAIGNAALTNATGANNVGIGVSAGSSIVSATQGTFIGSNAGSAVTGGNNTAVGYFAGRVVAGTGNTSMGQQALRGSGNVNSVAIGQTSMNFNNGSYCAFVGADAGTTSLSFSSTGNYNNGLGYQAGYDVGGATTGSSNTVIGDRIGLPSRTSSNQFIYGINGVNYLTRFTGGGWHINYTSSAVTTQTASAAFEINGTTGGVLIPRMTRAQKIAISSPVVGLMVYDTDNKAMWMNLNASTTTYGAIYAAQDTVATDANFTLPDYSSFVNLPTISADRTLTLPAAASFENKTIVIKVANSAGFAWLTSVALKDATDADVSTLTNDTVYTIFSDGTNWLIISKYQ